MNILQRLIDIGYTKEEAERIYNMYESNGCLEDLQGFIEAKEMRGI